MFRLVTDPSAGNRACSPFLMFYVPLLNELALKDATTARLMKTIFLAVVDYLFQIRLFPETEKK